MITRIGLAPRRRGLHIDMFQLHWLEVHAPLVAKLKGLQRYWQNHAILRRGEPLLPWPGFDACSEMQFADLTAMQSAFADVDYQRRTLADTEYLIDKSKSGVVLAERVLDAPADLTVVRLMTFLRRAPQCAPDAFRKSLLEAPKAARARARELYLSLDSATFEVAPSSFDAVEVQWFDEEWQAESYVTSTEAREHREGFAHLVRGVERLVARPHVVI